MLLLALVLFNRGIKYSKISNCNRQIVVANGGHILYKAVQVNNPRHILTITALEVADKGFTQEILLRLVPTCLK